MDTVKCAPTPLCSWPFPQLVDAQCKLQEVLSIIQKVDNVVKDKNDNANNDIIGINDISVNEDNILDSELISDDQVRQKVLAVRAI